jgi:hypothetical protein
MYPSLFEEVEDDRFRESEDDKGFYSSEDDQLTYSDQEEIEQALYAQIHYCQDTDYEEEFDDKCLENTNDHNSIELYDRQITVKSLNKIDNKKSLETGKSTSTEKRAKKTNENIKATKAKTNKTESDNSVIVINSHTQSSYSEAISVSSDDEINMSSDIDIDSDYMMLDETFDDMGDIVINIHDNQKTMLENLTVRNIKEHEKGK